MERVLSQQPTAKTSPSIFAPLVGDAPPLAPVGPPTPGIKTMQKTGARRSIRYVSSPC